MHCGAPPVAASSRSTSPSTAQLQQGSTTCACSTETTFLTAPTADAAPACIGRPVYMLRRPGGPRGGWPPEASALGSRCTTWQARVHDGCHSREEYGCYQVAARKALFARPARQHTCPSAHGHAQLMVGSGDSVPVQVRIRLPPHGLHATSSSQEARRPVPGSHARETRTSGSHGTRQRRASSSVPPAVVLVLRAAVLVAGPAPAPCAASRGGHGRAPAMARWLRSQAVRLREGVLLVDAPQPVPAQHGTARGGAARHGIRTRRNRKEADAPGHGTVWSAAR